MSIDPTILRVMQAKGVDVDTILAVIEADHMKSEAIAAERKAAVAAQKRAYRAKLKADADQFKSDKSGGLARTSEDFPGHLGLDPSPDKESPHTPKKTNPNPPSLCSGERSAREKLFARFWAAFPKKPGNPKQPAEEKFYRLLKAGTDGEAMVAGAELYAVARSGQDPQFTCSAIVFLNQSRWKDDHAPPSVLPFDPRARAGPFQRADAIETGHEYLARKRAEREQADQRSLDRIVEILPALSFERR